MSSVHVPLPSPLPFAAAVRQMVSARGHSPINWKPVKVRLCNHCQSLPSEGDVTLSGSRRVVVPNKGSRLRLPTSLELVSCANPLTPLSLKRSKRCPVRDSGSVKMAFPLCATHLNSKYCRVAMKAPAELHVNHPVNQSFPDAARRNRDSRLRLYILTLWMCRQLFACCVVHTHKCTP